MSMGLPVVATAVNGAREAIEEGIEHPAGAVVPLGDMPAMLREINRRLDDPQLLADEGRAARARAEVMFQPSDVFRRLDAAYRDAMHEVAHEGVSA
jgi:glycosyltransferase involved in cell wall biosynthesis